MSRMLSDAISYACLGGLIIATVVLITRRAQGMLSEPLSATPLFVAGQLVAALATLAQWPHVWRIIPFRRETINAADVALFGAPAALALIFAATITLPGTTFGGGLLLWLPIIGASVAVVALHRRCVNRAEFQMLAEQRIPSLLNESPRRSLHETSEESLADDATQQWIRRTIDGADVLEGMARAHFESGVRVTNLHVGVCPPFAGTPEVFAEVIDDSGASVKVAEALPFGVRLEVRLTDSCDANANVVVAVVARS